jgi:drug/metabolite transporter (DMT)-like permease
MQQQMCEVRGQGRGIVAGRSAQSPRGRVLLLLAFGIIYVAWGSTYLATRVAVEVLPPLLMMAVRHTVAGLALFAFCVPVSRQTLRSVDWSTVFVSAAFFFVGGHGILSWALQSVDSGIAALLFATMPMWLVLLQWLPAGKKPESLTLAGVGVGFAGVAVLVLPSLTDEGALGGFANVALVAGAMFWAIGSLLSRRRPPHQDVRLSVALQLLCGGLLLGMVGAARGEVGHVAPAAVGYESMTALVYLIVVGSLTGFWAYAWLLRVARPSVVGTYAFVNPIVAVVIGRFLGGENLDFRTVSAGFVVVAGVIITHFSSRR